MRLRSTSSRKALLPLLLCALAVGVVVACGDEGDGGGTGGTGGAGGTAANGGEGPSGGSSMGGGSGGTDTSMGGMGGDPEPTLPAKPGFGLTAGGVKASSETFTGIFTLGDAPTGNLVMTSENHRLEGGLVGATQK